MTPNADYEKPLVDDLADVLVHMVVGWEHTCLGIDLSQHPEVRRVMKRYRESRVSPIDGSEADK